MRPKVVKLSRRREKSGALGGTVRLCYDEEKIRHEFMSRAYAPEHLPCYTVPVVEKP